MGGTVFDEDLPSVQTEVLSVNGSSYRISDISLPVTDPGDGEKLYAAVCAENTGDAQSELSELRPVYVRLNEG